MECNKDEAIKAKEVALKKMESNDFDGARKMAMKAQLLFPDLENITQLLAVCNVHCSAQSQVLGTEKDWYGILQLERKVDEVTIKKQYRKLALVLHPDKNQFPGAEAAFKLIGEANLVLSDKDKKAIYDSKIGAMSKSDQMKNPPNIPSPWGKNGVHNDSFTQFKVQKNPQSTAQFNANGLERFWTSCPFCHINYQYHRNIGGMNITCPNCKKHFIAFDIGVAPGTNRTHAVPQGVPVPKRSTYPSQAVPQGMPSRFNNQPQASNIGKPCKLNNQNNYFAHGIPVAEKVNQSSASQATSTTSASQTAGFQPPHLGCPSKHGGASSSGVWPDGVTTFRHRMKPVEDRGKNNKRKRKSKLDAESSDSSDTSSSSDSEEAIADTGAAQTFGSDGLYMPRRSSRTKHNVSYVEPQGDDDNFDCPTQRSRVGKSSCDSDAQHEASDSLNKGRSPEEHAFSGKSEMNGGAQGVETIHDLDSDSNSDSDSDSESESCSDDDVRTEKYDCPDPEFHNFDKLREENCFKVDQFWACYGDSDSMPRFYAQVKKVCSNPFSVQISWLEFKPDDSLSSDWSESGLPISCGIYKRGSSDTVGLLTFSHQIVYYNGKRKGTFMIYPRKGTIWALFRDWDTNWVNDSTRPKEYTYDIVEVLSEFSKDDGIQVTLLEKVKGFVSIFHRNSDRTVSIPPNEMLRFSHEIPFYKMKGDEKDGVPAGSFELDTASVNLEQEADIQKTNLTPK